MKYQEIDKFSWSEWKKFPNPKLGEYIYAPFGSGVYQLKNLQTGELVLFGKGKNVAYRMTSLLPLPYGAGTRKNMEKRRYVSAHINHIVYRTLAINIEEAYLIEQTLKKLKIHIFNT